MATTGLAREIKKVHPFERPAEEAYLNVLRTAAVLVAPFERFFREHGLSEATYNVLRILRGARDAAGASDGLPSQEIGGRLVTRVPDVTRLVDRLEADGLVRRARTSEDRRVVLVQITRRGLDLLAKLDGPVNELHERLLAHLSRRELDELNRLLVKARSGPPPPG
jgi:DNA-binding MarR family transcriptional regulator